MARVYADVLSLYFLSPSIDSSIFLDGLVTAMVSLSGEAGKTSLLHRECANERTLWRDSQVNQHMPRSYWDYDSVNIQWGVLENYEVVRKIGWSSKITLQHFGGLVSDSMLGRTWKIFGSF